MRTIPELPRQAAAPTALDERTAQIHSLPPRPEAAAEARRIIATACEQWARGEICDSAALVVTELVANGVRHAGTRLTMCLLPIEQGIRLEVADDSPREIRARDARLLDEGGRGLFLVDALAQRWGVDAHPAGKRVWAEITA